MRPKISVLLLIALPASGKSEVRRCLEMIRSREPNEFARLGIGELVQLDDYPYVEFMRLTDLVRAELGLPPIFFNGPKGGFRNDRDWMTLIHFLNEDFKEIIKPELKFDQHAAVLDLFNRFDRADEKVGNTPRFAAFSNKTRTALATAVVEWINHPKSKDKMSAAKELVLKPYHWRVPSLEGKTVVIEFSRGIPKGAALPAVFPFGYRHSLAALCLDILKTAFVLYIKVALKDSIRKDAERVEVDQNHHGPVDSSIVHGLSLAVREGAYWGDDFEGLLASDGWVSFKRHYDNLVIEMPAAIFDNTGAGCTDVFRRHPSTWTDEETAPAVAKLKAAFAKLNEIGD